MADQHFIIATAGHVDHGKSALVHALTGTDPDRLPEEKARGITIDLGFAHLTLPAPAPSSDTLRLGIVDVPGHEDFVKNMVAGVGSVDAALFVVAADDGWMAQTEEHLQILTYLGVRRAVIALTKMDLAPSLAAAMETVRAALRFSPFEDAPIVPTSIINGQGFDELKTALADVLADAPMPCEAGKPRLPVDRVFALRGIGTVVTGTLTGGAFHREEAVVAQPSGRAGHIRTLQNHGRDVESSGPGTRTALNLPEFDAAGPDALARGQVITLAGLGSPATTLDVLLTRAGRADPNFSRRPPVRALKDGTHVRVHHGSGAWTARVRLLDRGSLATGGRAVARLRFETPIFTFVGDRLILRDGAQRATVAGGIVLDPDPGRRPLRRAAQRRFLERRAAHAHAHTADPVEAVAAFLERDRAILQTALLLKSPFSAEQIAAAAKQLMARGGAVAAGDFVVDAAWWQTLRRRALDRMDDHHRAHPEQIGLPLSRLRAELARELSGPGLFDALVADLAAGGECIKVGAAIKRASHRPTLPANLRTAGERLRAALAVKPFEPPSRKELAPDAVTRQALRFLCDTGEAMGFGEDIILLQENYRRMRTIILRTLRAAGPTTTSELRQVLGTTRRVLIPVLETLDHEGVTRREGDRRALK